MNPIVSLEDVSLRYHSIGGETSAVSHLSLSVQAGEFISIVGPSGCGKSTILSMLAGQLAPSEGSIYIGGTIGYMLQKDYLLQWRSIRSNALLGLEIQKKLTPENIAYVDTLLTQYGLGDFKNSLPNQLSGGMRQRIMIAMALICNPKVLFADEPTTALDVTIQAQIIELMNDLKDKIDTSIVLITHDMGVVANMADRIYVMYAGQIVEHGDCDTIFHHPKHPYTWGLLSSVPRLDKRVSEDLYSIPGTPPDLLAPPVGCAFAARCKYAMNICRTSQPPCINFSELDHYASCWLNHPACIKKNGAPKSPVEAQNIKEEE